MAVTISPPHVSFTPGSSYLLDALVSIPLPFLFLSPASSLYGGLFHLFLGLFVPLFGSSSFWRFIALRLRQVFYALPLRHSPIATFPRDVPARSRLSLLRLIILFFILCFFGFPIFCFLYLFFVWRSFPFVFGAFCALVWVFRLLAFHSPPSAASLLRTTTASFSHRHLPQRCSS
jgi:hypothetical protein